MRVVYRQAAEIAAEEKKLEETRQTALAEQRRLLALETEEALKLQDSEIGLLIGRLQVNYNKKKVSVTIMAGST